MSTSAHYDTIIIGGGLAGLTVAEYLAKQGKEVAVLEKYPAWGGRAATYRDKGIQYEIGAGRIYKDHVRVHALVKRFGLSTYPIGTSSNYEHKPNHFLTLFEPLAAVLQKLPAKILATHTIAELVPASYAPILSMYPYMAEIHMLRADRALDLFKPATGPMSARGASDFYGVVEGIDSLASGLRETADKHGAHLLNRHRVHNVKRIKTMFEVTGDYGKKAEAKPFSYTARRVVFATCRCSWSDFPILSTMRAMKQVGTSALMRIYAVYPPDPKTQKVWFADLPKTVTDNPLRYVIPIDPKKGLIMISYTDGKDTDYWRRIPDEKLQEAIQTQVHAAFPEQHIPEPLFLKRHDWPSGCSYWLPGDYDVEEAIKEAMNPLPGVYIVGESVSLNQTWMEGALESAERLINDVL
jgi:monoamine oxidase